MFGVAIEQEPTAVRRRFFAARPRTIPCVVVPGGGLVRLVTGTNLVGRALNATVCLAAAGVSRRHAKIVVTGEEAVVYDLDSTNGTWVDDAAVRCERLRDGSRIRLGPDAELLFGLWDESALDDAGGEVERGAVLSKRELEVAQLVAEGLRNAQVADELQISERTVKAHLTNIYDRLGFRGRASLTRYVLQNGLAR